MSQNGWKNLIEGALDSVDSRLDSILFAAPFAVAIFIYLFINSERHRKLITKYALLKRNYMNFILTKIKGILFYCWLCDVGEM